MAQLICRYRKGEQVRWISHLDLKRTLERAMRRAELPLELTQGHNPHPKVSFGPPLPLGATGEGELLAFHLAEALDPDEVKERLNRQLPSGIEMAHIWRRLGHQAKETFGDIDVAHYQVSVQGPADSTELNRRIHELLAQEEIIVQRGGKRPERTVDLRPLILALSIHPSGGEEIDLRMRLRTGSRGGARPQEVVSLLGLSRDDLIVRYHRLGLHSGAEAPAEKPKPAWRRWSRSRHSKERRERE